MVSIVIPSLNSPLIDQVIKRLKAQDGYDRFVDAVIVVGKDDPGLLQVDTVVKLVDTGDPVPPGTARNIGIQKTDSPLLIFLDSDCLPQPGWLQAHLAAHAAGHTVVGGSVLPSGVNYWALSYNLTMFHDYLSTAVAGPRTLLPTLNLSVNRQVIATVGLLDESLPRSQDLDWTTRMNSAGFQPYFWPRAIVEHQHKRTTFPAVWQDCMRSGVYSRQARVRHRKTLKTPFILRHRWLVLLLAPLIAAGVTLKIGAQRPSPLRHNWHTLPAIYASKIAWCWGAGKGSQDGG